MDITEDHGYQQVLQKCKAFQVVVLTLLMGPRSITGMCLLFMAFGGYNPGWRCLDQINDNDEMSNGAVTSPNITNTSSEYLTDSCDIFESCRRVEFNPAASTVVTEWGLVCHRAWINSFIISVMMAGLPVGTMMNGFFGDRFGRKWTIYISLLLLGVLHLIGMYSVNWEMYAAIRFLMGVQCGILVYGPLVLSSEFIPAVWRPMSQSIPTWNIGILSFCVGAMVTKNWESIHLITAIYAFVSFLPCVWVPESLRWLITNGKKEQSKAVLKKIAKMNKIDVSDENMINILDKEETKEKIETVRYTFIDLFKKRFKFTAIVGISFISIDLIYFATSFGVAIFPGNIYMNMIIMSSSELPSNFISSLIPNLCGRRITVASSFVLAALFYASVAFLDLYADYDVRIYGILALVSTGKVFLNCAWYVMGVQVAELYPTVLRSTAVGFTGFCGGIGSIIAPYLIPTSEGTLYVNYFATGALLVICGLLSLQLPETKGKALPDTWEEEFQEFDS